MSRELRVNMDEILEAMTSGEPGLITWYLDLTSGSVVSLTDSDFDDDDESTRLREEIEEHHERYEEIQRFESREDFEPLVPLL